MDNQLNAADDDDDNADVNNHTSVHPNVKTICALKQLSTFYNPAATAYDWQHLHAHNDATVATSNTSNQLGREDAKSNLETG